jgi:uncharacterized protein (DUF3820 family)
LIDLPEYYVVWYNNKGFPRGVRRTIKTYIWVKTERAGRIDKEYQKIS